MPKQVTFAQLLISVSILTTFLAVVASWAWALGKLWRRRPLLPPGSPRIVPWRALTVLLIIVAYFVVNGLVVFSYLGLTGRPKGLKPTFEEQMMLVSVCNAVLLVVIPRLLYWSSGARPRDFGLVGQGLGRNALAGAVGFCLVLFPVYLVNGLSLLIWKPHNHPLLEMIQEAGASGLSFRMVVLSLGSAVVFAPLAEELIFRGVIQGWLQRVFLRPAPPSPEELGVVPSPRDEAPPGPKVGSSGEFNPYAPPAPFEVEVEVEEPAVEPIRPWQSALPIVITSVLFAAVHAAQWPAPIAIFFLSLGLGYVFQRTGSLVASIVLHALFNGLSTLALFLAILTGQMPNPKVIPPDAREAAPALPPQANLAKSVRVPAFSVGAREGDW